MCNYTRLNMVETNKILRNLPACTWLLYVDKFFGSIAMWRKGEDWGIEEGRGEEKKKKKKFNSVYYSVTKTNDYYYYHV